MGVDRRGFLKLIGLAGVGVAGRPALELLLKEASATDSDRWLMIIDLRKCLKLKGCTKCVEACHAEHNVPDVGEEKKSKEEIKWIWKHRFEGAFPNIEHEHLAEQLHHKMIPVLCNQCDNPPCVRVCPTQATFRRDDGIVAMDMHRCIGCRYCMAACPYGSRSFNWSDPRKYLKKEDMKSDFPPRTKGVVEKCNFCTERLSLGKKPACVEICPGSAMFFGNLKHKQDRAGVKHILSQNFSIRRKSGLGTRPQVFYLV